MPSLDVSLQTGMTNASFEKSKPNTVLLPLGEMQLPMRKVFAGLILRVLSRKRCKSLKGWRPTPRSYHQKGPGIAAVT